MTIRATALSDALISRYGIGALDCEGWDEIELFGGMGMDVRTFNAIANAAMSRGDIQATIYEMESIKHEFSPLTIQLDFSSFNLLKGNVISHFDVAMVPASKGWVVLLTNDQETFVFGPPEFLIEVAENAPKMANRS